VTRVRVRLVRPSDAATVAALIHDNQGHLLIPRRTADEQLGRIEQELAEQAAGRMWPGVIEVDGLVAGRVSLHDIVLGSLRSTFVSYWLAENQTGRGVATRALADVLDLAFEDLALHRVDAFVRPDNLASRRVLERNGFEEIGLARRHTHVDGRWQDELLTQRLAPWDDGELLHPDLSF
jgi:ribosomal-protein-alanine N-acetyltransferase